VVFVVSEFFSNFPLLPHSVVPMILAEAAMKDRERRKYEMLLRIRDFGNMNREVLAGLPPAGPTAFESVNAAVNALTATDVMKLSARMAARADRKANARNALIKLLVRTSQLARVLRARGYVLPVFEIPRSSSDQGWLTRARQFARDAEPFDAEFDGHGVGPKTIATVADAFEKATRDREMKRADHIEARMRIRHLLRSALLDVRRLDLMVQRQFARDTVIRTVWTQVRRVENPWRPAANPPWGGPAGREAAPMQTGGVN